VIFKQDVENKRPQCLMSGHSCKLGLVSEMCLTLLVEVISAENTAIMLYFLYSKTRKKFYKHLLLHEKSAFPCGCSILVLLAIGTLRNHPELLELLYFALAQACSMLYFAILDQIASTGVTNG
jgi:hypothetical protein